MKIEAGVSKPEEEISTPIFLEAVSIGKGDRKQVQPS